MIKTFGINVDGINRAIVATETKIRAFEILGTYYRMYFTYFKKHVSETGNDNEKRIAEAKPETVFVSPMNKDNHKEYGARK